MHGKHPFSTGLQVKLMKTVGKAFWPPPIGEMCRIGPCFKNQLPGKINGSG